MTRRSHGHYRLLKTNPRWGTLHDPTAPWWVMQYDAGDDSWAPICHRGYQSWAGAYGWLAENHDLFDLDEDEDPMTSKSAHAAGVLVSMNDVRPECPDCGATADNEEGQ
ncbi:hypothetical protein [Nocardiopsis composta]|uniref:Uncharacterized protein n=1 Tax=Nocardiopsis composta TaxID=157465 RepID=A0A7W8QKC2_9ACTN|nr:hypothetical protein [Nocardiopsis composta]MBB5431370.1 hypothetical protein [Nocardiopsis composta]